MITDEQLLDLISDLRGDQSDLRLELAPYQAKATRVFSAPHVGLKTDITAKRIRQIKHEIESKERVIAALRSGRAGSDGSDLGN
jgi:hypothetical protein